MQTVLSAVALLLCTAFASQASASPSAAPGSGGWASLRIPGRVTGLLDVAGLDPSRPRTTALRDVIRVIYESPERADARIDERRTRVLDYLAALTAFEHAVTATGPTVPAGVPAADKDQRARFEALATALGCTLTPEGRGYRLLPASTSSHASRREHLRTAGLDVDDAMTRINRGDPISLALPSDDVPLPLPPDVWPSLTRAKTAYAASLVASILSDRTAAMLYYGLTTLDDATRGYLAEHAAVVRAIAKPDRAGVFAGFGRSIRIASGRALVPGGDEVEPLWEALAGASPRDPERFVPALLDRDGGRLALLYDTAMLLDEPRRRFLLGLWDADPESRLRRFRRVYRAMGPGLAGWDPRVRPFYRSRYDLAHVLVMTPVREDGTLQGPRGGGFWRRVFAGGGLLSDPSAAGDALAEEDTIDAAGMVDLLAGVDYSAPKAETWWFGHRVFAGASAFQLPDVLVALRGLGRDRVLGATLERIGVTDPSVYAAAMVTADTLVSLGNGERARTAYALFQGGLSLVDRARLGRVIEPARAEDLVRVLCNLPVSAEDGFAGAVGRWVEDAYLPAVIQGLGDADGAPAERSAEDVVLAAFAGRTLGPADSPNLRLTLEGLSYVVDLAGAEQARLRDIRRRQRGLSIDAVLPLLRAAANVMDPGAPAASFRARVSDVEQAVSGVLSAAENGAAEWLDGKALARDARRVVDAARTTGRTADLTLAARDLLRRADDLLARALVSLAYAPHVADPDGLLLMAGDPSVRHDWGLTLPLLDAPVANPWLLARQDTGRTGWFLRGSILGLDIALGEQALRRVVADHVPEAPTIKDSDRFAVIDGVVLANPFDCTDAGREVVVTALARGRARLETLETAPEAWPAIAAEAGITDLRRHLLSWTLANEADRMNEFLSLGEVMRLGMDPAVDAAHLDVWGTSGRWLDGRWAVVFPPSQAVELLAGRRGSALVAALLPDLSLAMAEAVGARGLPAALTRSVLSAAAQDYIDEVRLAYEDDWLAMVAAVPRLAERVDEYVAALTVGGPLRPEGRQE